MVILTQSEIQIAMMIGGQRMSESIQRGWKAAHGHDGVSAWDIHIEGAAAEMAYSKYRGVYWGGCVNTFGAADVGANVQIRSTKRLDGCLVVRESDRDDHYYVLVVGHIPQFEIVGWILGRDAKQVRWLRSPNGREPAYFVPQNELKRF